MILPRLIARVDLLNVQSQRERRVQELVGGAVNCVDLEGLGGVGLRAAF
jgi:hypothetical protein